MSDLNQKILEKLIKENQFNNKCADCDTKFARWASVNLGIFLCQNCAGIHRGLGTHISYVKSVNLDEWTIDMIENMKKNGNEKINKLYEANLNMKKPDLNSDLDERRNFIEKKYRDKKFYCDTNIINQSYNFNENIIKKEINKDIDLLLFETKNDKEQNDLFYFSNENNIQHFDNKEVENKINKINDMMNQEYTYQQQLYQQQLYQQQLYQQQLYQQQLYQQQLYQQQLYQQQLYQQQLYQQQLYQQQMQQNKKN